MRIPDILHLISTSQDCHHELNNIIITNLHFHGSLVMIPTGLNYLWATWVGSVLFTDCFMELFYGRAPDSIFKADLSDLI